MNLTPEKLQVILDELLELPAETEWVEFKKTQSNFKDIGKYFSALSNEANLNGKDNGWLIFGVKEKPHTIVGTHYCKERKSLDKLKHEIAQYTTGGISFVDIYVIQRQEKRVIMFQIPPAPKGLPIAWKGHFYGRNGESLSPLSLSEMDRIRGGAIKDWSKSICHDATIADLDEDAIQFAREQYKRRNPQLAMSCDEWDNVSFLNKVKLCIAGKVTRTALLLLGKPESTHFISPSVAEITWTVRDEHGKMRDFHHFTMPLIQSAERVFDKVRNLTFRYLQNDSLFPAEITQYDPWVLREILHNCIAHQDYTKGGKINVVEEPDSLLFTNRGSFLPGSVEEVIRMDAPPDQYRNIFLTEAMRNLNMIETIGSGIRKILERQQKRFFPMPDFDLRDPERVKVRLYGKILDENYTRLLIEIANINLPDVFALDKVQKKCPLSDEEFKRLKSRKFIEGRRPNIFVAANIAAATGQEVAYVRNKSMDKDFYQRQIIDLLKLGEAPRSKINELLLDKMSDMLNEEQKFNRIRNLLQEMRRAHIIEPVGRGIGSKWKLCK